MRAYDVLQDRLGAYETGDTDVSFLADLVGGDFTSYDTQRKQLASIYFGLTGQEPAGQKTSLKTKHVSSRVAPPKRLSSQEDRSALRRK